MWSLTLNVMLSEVMTEVMVYSVLFSSNFGFERNVNI